MGRFSLKGYNFRLVFLIVILNIIGILVINSASGGSAENVERQIAGICVGIVAMGIISFFPYRTLLKFALPIYLVCVGLLALVLVLGLIHGGARRWIVLPLLGQIQPSEFVKSGLIVFFAWFLGENADKVSTPRILLLTALFAAVPLALILLEPDLSTTIIIAVTIVAMIYVSGISYRIILITAAIVVPLVAGFLLLIKNGILNLDKYYQINRILAWFDPSSYTDASQQTSNSIMAIASGKLFGKGLNTESLSSVKNGNFLPAATTDFIFSVIGEELGFVGCLAVILLFAFIVFECLHMAHKAQDMEGRIICTGVGVLIAFQSFTNIAVTTGIFPNTGLPLPFVSFGNSSLLSMYIGVGLALSTRQAPKNVRKQPRRLLYENRFSGT